MPKTVINFRNSKSGVAMSNISALKIRKVQSTARTEFSRILFDELGQPEAVKMTLDSDKDLLEIVADPADQGKKVSSLGKTKLIYGLGLYETLYSHSIVLDDEEIVVFPCTEVVEDENGQKVAVIDLSKKMI